jgi:5-hydroxyisourate hydrolase-like protein (transthyretin family)
VAWKLSQNGYTMPPRAGNANNWDDFFRARGVVVNGTPAVGAIAQTDAGRYGHVAYVEAVGKGTVTLSEYNVPFPYGAFHTRTVPTSSFVYIHVKDLASSSATRDLAYVKWAPTGSGRIEVHTATAASGYAGFGVHAATPIGAGDTNGVFDMADVNADGRADLVYIKRRNTGSGRIEVHWVNAATGYRGYGGNLASVFSAVDDPNGSFEMADMNGDGRADLVFTKNRNTGSGRVELHWADAVGGYARFGANLVTGFSPADAGNGYFHPADMNADGRVDLAFVKIRNTGSGRIEVHWVNAAAGYGSFGGHHATALHGGERTNGWFETVDMNGDRAADLVFVKDHNVGSGRIELHWLDARTGFSRLAASAATAFSGAEAGHGFFTVM